MDETKITNGSLIPAEKVNGTNVYNLRGEKLGHVEDIMIDKASGRACYAVMSFGGFLGMGKRYHPLPWSTLHYDEQKGGYVVPMSTEQLKNAPTYDPASPPSWSDRTYEQNIHEYYRTKPYWDA